MASTYSSSLRFTLQGSGDNPGTWGAIANVVFGTLIEQAIAGYGAIVMPADANYTLTTANGSSDEARNAVLSVTSGVSLTATRSVTIPAVSKAYVVRNLTTGGQSITITTGGGSSATLANGCSAVVYCDGTNCTRASLNYSASADALTCATGFFTTVSATTGTYSGVVSVGRAVAFSTYLKVGNEVNGLYSDSANTAKIATGGVLAATISSTGDITAVGNVSWSSDRRLKRDIAPLTGGLRRLRKLVPSTWARRANGQRQLGLVAQDAKAAHPLAATKGEDGMLAINGPAIDAIVAAAALDLDALVRAQAATIRDLTKRLARLERRRGDDQRSRRDDRGSRSGD